MIESINLSFQCNVETISHSLGACGCPLSKRKFSLQRVVLRLFEVFSLHWGLRVCIGLVGTASCKNVETRRKTDLSLNCCLQWRIQGRGPGPTLFLDQNELLMNTTLVIDGKSLSVECCLQTENAPRRQSTV